MSFYPVTDPSKLEKMLFDAGLVIEVPLADIYDIKAHTSIQQSWQNPDKCATTPDVHDPSQWNDKLHACIRGEFFVHALKDCRRVLDVGCGEGWPSLYLARSIPEVVGLDLSPEHIALARNTARLMRLDNVRFEVGDIESLPFPDQSFDGVCFGGFVFTYRDQSNHRTMLHELCRVLQSDRKPSASVSEANSPFAFEQVPAQVPKAGVLPAQDGISWFIDGGPPILHTWALGGPYVREHFIYLKPESRQGKRLAELAERMSGELSEEQRQACEEIKREIEDGALDIVEKAIYSGEGRGPTADEFLAMLEETGFTDVVSWALPDAVKFARSLQHDGVLSRLQQEYLIPCLRALVKSAPTTRGWVHGWVTCRKL